MNNYWNTIWKCIHVIGKTFDPDNENAKESFVCLFECLVDLLPDDMARKNLSSFMQQYPVERYIQSNIKTFEWTYRLHSYINLIKRRQGQLSNDITIQQAHTKYSMITKPDWARPIWFLIHFIAANLPLNLTQQQKISFKALIVCLRYLLPCEECRGHMSQYINSTEIDPYLDTRNSVFTWTFNFHNAVNKRLNKPLLDIKQAFVMYQVPTTNSVYTLIDY